MPPKTVSQSELPTKLQVYIAAMKEAISPQLEKLSPEERALIENNIQALSNKICQEVGAAIKLSETTLEEDFFDEAAFNQKLDKLRAYGSRMEFRQVKEIPRNGVDGWKSASEYIKNALGKFFKIIFIEAKNTDSGQEWVQPVMVQEESQLDSGTCNKVLGNLTLPLRLRNGRVEAGITIKNPVGTFGKALFSAPRSSNSNTNKSEFLKIEEVFWRKFLRPDAMRMSGQIDNTIVLLNEADVANVDDDKEKVVWFSTAELERLIEGTRNGKQSKQQAKESGNGDESTDAPTLVLISYVLLHKGEILENLRRVSGV